MFETGLSDFHKLVVTVLKSPPNIITCRSYKNFSNKLLRDDLNSLLSKETMTLEFTGPASFTQKFIEILNKHAPIKKTYIRSNQANVVIKRLRKAIMLTTNNATFALK